MPDVLEAAFSEAPIGMAVVDMSGRVLRVNEALCRITGYTNAQICARSFRHLSDPHDADVEALQNRDLLEGRVAAYQVEKRYRHALGHSVWVLLSVSLVRDRQGEFDLLKERACSRNSASANPVLSAVTTYVPGLTPANSKCLSSSVVF